MLKFALSSAVHLESYFSVAIGADETVHQLFIDFKKAYDSVRREVLYNILLEFGMPLKLVR
jgi:hypothetical protein